MNNLMMTNYSDAYVSLGKPNALTHWPPIMPYGFIEVGQHWPRYWLAAWQYQAITRTNADLSGASNDALATDPQNQSEYCLLKFQWNLRGVNGLNAAERYKVFV